MIKKLIIMLFVFLLSPQIQAQDFTNPSSESSNTQQEESKGVFNPYDKKYRKDFSSMKDDEEEDKTIKIGDRYGIYFIRDDNTPTNTATLRIARPITMTGCLVIEPPTVTTEIQPPFMNAMITDPKIMHDENPKYSQKPCQTGMNRAYVDLKIDRDLVIKNNVRYLSLKTETASDRYEIDIDNQRFYLTPKTPRVFMPQTITGQTNSLEYWFYPKNTLILTTDISGKYDAEALYKGIKNLANKESLISLSSSLAQFDQKIENTDQYYFVDESGKWVDKIAENRKILFGQFDLKQSIRNMSGTKEITKTVKVYARKPGLRD